MFYYFCGIFFILFGVVYSDLNYEQFEVVHKALQPNIICSAFNASPISENCKAQLVEACENVEVLLTMIDATSKFPYSGIQVSSRGDYGVFDECIGIDHKYNGGRILGKYCLFGLILPDIFNLSDPKNPDKVFKLSACLPNECSAQDYNSMFNGIFGNATPFLFQDQGCQTSEPLPWDNGNYVAIGIVGVYIVLMIVSTAFDMYLQKSQKKSPHPIYLSFSVITNGRKILQTTDKPAKDQILFFQGLRVVFMMWILAGHIYLVRKVQVTLNNDIATAAENKLYVAYMRGAFLSVDGFFFIGGFLLSFLYLKQRARPIIQQVISVPFLILNRYLRITPSAGMTWLIAMYLYKFVSSGPLGTHMTNIVREPCERHWVAFFLYTQNYNNYNDMCLGQTHYVDSDMQMFVLSPLILIPVSYFLNKGKFKQCVASLFMLATFAVILTIYLKIEFPDFINDNATHVKAGDFIMGIMMGVVIRETGDKPFLLNKFNARTASMINKILFMLSLICILWVIIWFQLSEMANTVESRAYAYAIGRHLLCISLSWILYSCYHGRGGYFNQFLSHPIFQILARLTFSMYLCHMFVIFHFIGRTRIAYFFDNYNMFIEWCGIFTITTMVSLVWTLAFESPMIVISKTILDAITPKGTKPAPKAPTGSNGTKSAV